MGENWKIEQKVKDFDVVYNDESTPEFEDLVDYMIAKKQLYEQENKMSNDWVHDIAGMHVKFGVNDVVRNLPQDKLKTFLQFRIDFLQEELDEMKDAKSADDVVDALIDLCVVAIGTLNAFDVDAYTAWNRVHTANMEKSPGVNPNRPNPLGLPDMIKPAGWAAPHHFDNVGLFSRLNWG